MHCSSFEVHLDEYVEDRVSAANRRRLDAHLTTCRRCSALHAEFRVIDALLQTPRRLTPAPDLTASVMADVRSLHPPRVRRESLAAILATYVAFGWLTIGAFFLWGGSYARAMLALLGQSVVHALALAQSLAGVTARSFGSRTFDVTAAMGELLAADAIVVTAVVAAFALHRARANVAGRASEPC